mgnify:FL=1
MSLIELIDIVSGFKVPAWYGALATGIQPGQFFNLSPAKRTAPLNNINQGTQMATPKKAAARTTVAALEQKIKKLEERLEGLQEQVNELPEEEGLNKDDVEEIAKEVIDGDEGLITEDRVNEIIEETLKDSENTTTEERVNELIGEYVEESDLATTDDVREIVAEKVDGILTDRIKNSFDVEFAIEGAIEDILSRDNVLSKHFKQLLEDKLKEEGTPARSQKKGGTADVEALLKDYLKAEVVDQKINDSVNRARTAAAERMDRIDQVNMRHTEDTRRLNNRVVELETNAKTLRDQAAQTDVFGIKRKLDNVEQSLMTLTGIATTQSQLDAAITKQKKYADDKVKSVETQINELRQGVIADWGRLHQRDDRLEVQQRELRQSTSAELLSYARALSNHKSDLVEMEKKLRSDIAALEARLAAPEAAVQAAPTDLKSEASAAGYRIAVKQVTKTIQAPLVARFAQLDPDHTEILKLLARSELGRAAIAATLSVGIDYAGQKVPVQYSAMAGKLAQECRVSAMADTADFAVDILMEPLRQVICDTITKRAPQGVNAEVLVEPKVEEVVIVAEAAQACATP